MPKLKRELFSSAAMQPVEQQRAAPSNKSVQTVKNQAHDNRRATRRYASTGYDNDDGDAPRRRVGKGYKLGPHAPKTVPTGAIWMTSNQLCARYGGKSHMWLWRRIKYDPCFPKPIYFGRMMMFSVAEQDEYDRIMISKTVGADR